MADPNKKTPAKKVKGVRPKRAPTVLDKEKELLSSPHDKEFEQRKLELWRRVKNAMTRWAQLRRMTKYGMLWLGDEEVKKVGHDEVNFPKKLKTKEKGFKKYPDIVCSYSAIKNLF
jgi:hypothetical protein